MSLFKIQQKIIKKYFGQVAITAKQINNQSNLSSENSVEESFFGVRW